MLALALGLAGALLLAEAGVRLSWTSAPGGAGQADSLPLAQVRDPEILYRLIPGSSGFFNGTQIQVNSLGLRDRDYPIPAAPSTYRILVLGDSMVFGIGLPPDQTLPGQLSRLLNPAQVINAGVFGYNLAQEISLLRDVGLKYRPDLVISCFVHNDIENWGLGEGGGVPGIKSSRFDPPPRDAWSTKLADLMLPGTFDPDRLNLLPRADGKRRLRHRLASMSRLYLFLYLRLRTHSWNLTSGERRDPLVGSPACQIQEVIWGPLRQRYRMLQETTHEAGARLAVVIQGGLIWEGRPLRRLHDLLREEGIPFLDLSPVWLDRGSYAREYSLGWDPHPNARANGVAAAVTARFLRQAGLLPLSGRAEPAGPPSAAPGPYDAISTSPDLRGRVVQWKARQVELEALERQDWSRAAGRFSSSLSFEDPAQAPPQGQVLYGFWDPEARPFTQAPPSSGRWMSAQAAVLLSRPAGAQSLVIHLSVPDPAEARERTPKRLRVTLGAPPERCGVASFDLPVGPAALRVGLPASLQGASPIEVGLSVDHPFPATYLNPQTRDPRLISFLVRRIALE